MSALPPKADIAWRQLDVRFVPKADIHNKESAPQSLFTVALPPDPDVQRRGRAFRCRQCAR
jgi:hypothetical protein